MSRKLTMPIGDGRTIKVNEDVYYYISSLKDEICDLKFDLRKAEHELKAIKPIVESKDLKYAISEFCGSCRFVVRSSYSHDIIGCRKGCVCDDFVEDKEREDADD